MLKAGVGLYNQTLIALFFSPPQFDECMLSRILTLDLRPFPLGEDPNGQHPDTKPSEDRGQESYSPGSPA